jgi:hypothetical protein
MSQFSLARSTKARRDLEARLRRNKLLHGRSAFVDRLTTVSEGDGLFPGFSQKAGKQMRLTQVA